jgi:hypothetical protein
MPTTPRSKLPYPASTDPADVPGDLSKLALALDEIAYTEFTANVSVTATTEATANTVVAASAVTFDGATAVLIEFFAAAMQPDINLAGRALLVWLYQDGTSIGEIAQVTAPTANQLQGPMSVKRRITPSAGSHTYSIRSSVNAGTGSFSAGAGGLSAVMPGFIRITRA